MENSHVIDKSFIKIINILLKTESQIIMYKTDNGITHYRYRHRWNLFVKTLWSHTPVF